PSRRDSGRDTSLLLLLAGSLIMECPPHMTVNRNPSVPRHSPDLPAVPNRWFSGLPDRDACKYWVYLIIRSIVADKTLIPNTSTADTCVGVGELFKATAHK